MPHSLSILASNAGRMASNHAFDCARALRTAADCDAGRIESTAPIASSSAYSALALRRNFRACRGVMVEISAEARTRMVTPSGVTGGIAACGSSNVFGDPDIRTVAVVRPYRAVNFHGKRGLSPLAKTNTVNGLPILGCEGHG
jgi:hypothetical protein